MSSEELNNLVLPGEGGGEIKEWIPEDYGFVTRDESRTVFLKGKYELRRFKYNNWLLRKNRKNSRGNSEMLVKWGMIVIEPAEIEFADMMFTLGVKIMADVVLVKVCEDSDYNIMIGYTPTGAINILSDNPMYTIIVEYDNTGKVLNMEVDTDPEVKTM